jgi:acetyl-CoA acetyltransferase
VKVSERVAAVGVGYSRTGRNTGLTPWQLAIQAAKAAMADAGMNPGDLDGVTVSSAAAGPTRSDTEQIDPMDIGYMLGITPLSFYSSAGSFPTYVGPAVQAFAAIRSGLAHTVLTLRIINQRMSASEEVNRAARGGPTYVTGDAQFTAPFGSVSGIFSIASLPAQRHMALYGTTEEQFGAHVVAQRWHASMNEDALHRDCITVEDYLASRYIAKPVRLLDCDYPVDSASAVIYTTGERARDWKPKPVYVEAASYSAIKYGTFENLDDMNRSAPFQAAQELWSRTDLKPSDVDCAQLYDGFTIIVFQWLEALGFCAPGESGPFVEGGNTRLGGRIPVNTDGGAANVGRRHGANFCIESIQQLRGQAGVRQVPGAEVAVWTNGVGPRCGAVLMTAE